MYNDASIIKFDFETITDRQVHMLYLRNDYIVEIQWPFNVMTENPEPRAGYTFKWVAPCSEFGGIKLIMFPDSLTAFEVHAQKLVHRTVTVRKAEEILDLLGL